MDAINPTLDQLRRIVDSAIAHTPGAESHVVPNHLSQIEDLILGQGVDFIPEIDPMGDRTSFVQGFLKQTHFLRYLSDIIRKVICTGEVLVWLRYTASGYRIRYYSKPEFVPFYTPETDDLYGAVVISPYTATVGGFEQRRWLKLVILREGTFVQHCDIRPTVTGIGDRADWTPLGASLLVDGAIDSELQDVQFVPSPFSQLPLVVLHNKATGPGQRSADDFSEFATQIVSHDRTMRAVGKNVRKFSRNTIFTNLSRSQIMRGGESESERSPGRYGDSPLRAAGYRSPYEAMPSEDDTEVLDVIGVDGLAGENFLTPIEWNAISTDQLQYLELIEDKLHWSMGSVAKRSGGTAFEVRANLSWGAATANKKSQSIFDAGLCLIISMAIAHQEGVYLQSDGALGLIPAGDPTVLWRRVELIQPSAQDQLQLSILGRNLEEEGVGTREILRLLFPSKTDKEIQAMTGGAGGVPFRKLEKSMPQLVQLYQTAMQLPPELGAELLPLANILVANLLEAINYGRGQSDSAGPDPAVSTGPTIPELFAGAIASGNTSGGSSSLRGSGLDIMGAGPVDPSIPSPGSNTGNPLVAAFGRITDWQRSPIARALGLVTPTGSRSGKSRGGSSGTGTI